MNGFENEILELADLYKNEPEIFISLINSSFLREESSDRKANFFFKIAIILNDNSYYYLSLACWEALLEYSIDNEKNDLQITCFLSIGDIYGNLRNYEEAMRYTKQGIDIAKQFNDEVAVYQSYGSLGLIAERNEKLGDAIEYYKKALEVANEINDVDGQIITYERLSEVYIRSGQFDTAINYLNELLDLNNTYENDNLVRRMNCCISLNCAFNYLENYSRAIEYGKRGLQIALKLNDLIAISKSYINLGITFKRLNEYDQAIEYFQESLKFSEQINDPSRKISCYMNLASVYQDLNDLGKSINYYNEALPIINQTNNKRAEAVWNTGMGVICCKSKNFSRALSYFEAALKINRELGDSNAEISNYLNLGNTYKDLDNFERAIYFYQISLELCKNVGNKLVEYGCNVGLGLVYYNLNPRFALKHFKLAVDNAELVRASLIDEIHILGFAARIEDTYRYLISLCLELHEKVQAFDYLEKSKSRAFLKLLSTVKIKPSVEITPQLQLLLQKEEEYLDLLYQNQAKYLTDKPSIEPFDFDEIKRSLDEVYNQIESKHHDFEYVFMRTGKSYSLNQIQSEISTYSKNIKIIEYFVAFDDTITIFIVSENRVDVERISFSLDKRKYISENYLRAIFLKEMSLDEALLGLGDCFLKPISKYLCEGDLICFVPHDFLHYLPLHCMDLDGLPLIRKYPVTYVFSSSIIQFCRRLGSGNLNRFVAFGVEFEEEARKVSILFNGDCYLGSSVTKKQVSQSIIDKDVIHFSCHGNFDPNESLNSGILLYGNELLSAREIFDLRLDAELVVLSACETGISERKSGDDLIGLTRSLIYAGSASVVVSLWQVDAKSTEELMLEFYRFLKNGLDKATSLQQAQIEIMERYKDSYYWAPFILVGDWE